MMRRLVTTDAGFNAALDALLAPPPSASDVSSAVAAIIARVRTEGDAALVALTAQHDRFAMTLDDLRLSEAAIDRAARAIPADQRVALDHAARRIETFHRAQLPADISFTDDDGVSLGLRWGPLDAVGIYVPGGKASYPSSVLMNAIPARIAGVARIAMVVPTPDGVVNDLVLAAASRAGVSEIYRIGGAQAVAALAYGTQTIAPVDRIVGPGNAYVAEAKRQVFGRVGIDNIAGPSEVLIIADGGNDAEHVALDLIAQAEHGADGQSILLTADAGFADAVAATIGRTLDAAPRATLARAAIARAALGARGAIILVTDHDEAVRLANRIAAEHLQIMTTDAEALLAGIRHAGSVFLGPDAPTAIGDYIAGPNHVLPTGGTARFSSGLSVFDFLKRTSITRLDRPALAQIGPDAITLAEAENLPSHARSIAVRIGARQ